MLIGMSTLTRAALTYKVHLDGYNNLDHWTGKTDKSAMMQSHN